SSRAAGSFRRNRRRLAMAASVLIAVTAVLAAALNLLLDRAASSKLVQLQFDKGMSSFSGDDFPAAKKDFDAVVDLVDHFAKPDLWTSLMRWRNFPISVKTLRDKLRELHFEVNLDELRHCALVKSKLADQIDRIRHHADAVFSASEVFRFRFLLG